MQTPEKPSGESQRIETLRTLKILDTAPEERFDRLTRLAKRLFGVPIALVSLVDQDRQWFKSCQGLDASETSRDVSFCGHAILEDDIFLIPDAALDHRFSDNPLVTDAPNIRFYAGCPLAVPNGSKLGTLCIIDREPRELDSDDLGLLRDLARMAEQELAAIQMATLDELTLLSNRRGFDALGGHALSMCQRMQLPASMLFFDLDHFKEINDRFGHAEGDRALEQFARMLMQSFRESDVVARLGGDEFVVLLTNTSEEAVALTLKRLEETTTRYNRKAARGYDLVFSVGAMQFDPARHSGISALLADADQLMYENKRQRHAVSASAINGNGVGAGRAVA